MNAHAEAIQNLAQATLVFLKIGCQESGLKQTDGIEALARVCSCLAVASGEVYKVDGRKFFLGLFDHYYTQMAAREGEKH